MKALITGASMGIGHDLAIVLSEMGYDLILVARCEDKLKELKDTLKTEVQYYVYDLSIPDNCFELYEITENQNIDLLINNAGFGKFGEFKDIDLQDELKMIDLNIKCLHILMKLYLNDFIKRDQGCILNVASSAGMVSGGPLMATYYATKSYVTKLTLGVNEELRRINSNVKINMLCPGPVKTFFNKTAGVNFSLHSKSSIDVAKYTIKKLQKNKLIIVPGISIRTLIFLKRFFSEKFFTKCTYFFQKKKFAK